MYIFIQFSGVEKVTMETLFGLIEKRCCRQRIAHHFRAYMKPRENAFSLQISPAILNVCP